jgi:hypothetical protein
VTACVPPVTLPRMTSVPAHVTPLNLTQAVRIDPSAAAGLLDDGAAGWLGTPVPGPDPANRRFLTDLSLPLRDHVVGVTFKKAAFVDLSNLRAGDGRCEVDISWRSTSLAPLFPVFAGKLTVTSEELRLDGFYAPPGGDVGAVLDKAFLNIAARGTARWFLGKVAEALSTPT